MSIKDPLNPSRPMILWPLTQQSVGYSKNTILNWNGYEFSILLVDRQVDSSGCSCPEAGGWNEVQMRVGFRCSELQVPEEALLLSTDFKSNREEVESCAWPGTGAVGSFPYPGHEGSFPSPTPRGWCGEGAYSHVSLSVQASWKGTHRLLCKDLTARIKVFILRSEETYTPSLVSEYCYTQLDLILPIRAGLGAGGPSPPCRGRASGAAPDVARGAPPLRTARGSGAAQSTRARGCQGRGWRCRDGGGHGEPGRAGGAGESGGRSAGPGRSAAASPFVWQHCRAPAGSFTFGRARAGAAEWRQGRPVHPGPGPARELPKFRPCCRARVSGTLSPRSSEAAASSCFAHQRRRSSDGRGGWQGRGRPALGTAWMCPLASCPAEPPRTGRGPEPPCCPGSSGDRSDQSLLWPSWDKSFEEWNLRSGKGVQRSIGLGGKPHRKMGFSNVMV